MPRVARDAHAFDQLVELLRRRIPAERHHAERSPVRGRRTAGTGTRRGRCRDRCRAPCATQRERALVQARDVRAQQRRDAEDDVRLPVRVPEHRAARGAAGRTARPRSRTAAPCGRRRRPGARAARRRRSRGRSAPPAAAASARRTCADDSWRQRIRDAAVAEDDHLVHAAGERRDLRASSRRGSGRPGRRPG